MSDTDIDFSPEGSTSGGSGGSSLSGLYCCPVSSLESSICAGECVRYNTSTCASLGTMVVNGVTVPKYKECVPPTPPQTTINVSATTGGTTSLQGSSTGTFGRTVTAAATPTPGYQFVRWEVSSTPITLPPGTVDPTQPPAPELQEFSVASNVATFDLVCPPTFTDDLNFNSYQQISQVLYTDGQLLYRDNRGTSPAQIGYYGVGNGFYFNYTGAGVPTIQQCPISSAQTSGGGGGGSGDTRLQDDGSVGFDDGINVF